jgi:hypothetical protein
VRAVAAQHHEAHAVVVARVNQRVERLDAGLRRQAVARRRIAQRQDQCAVAPLGQHS